MKILPVHAVLVALLISTAAFSLSLPGLSFAADEEDGTASANNSNNTSVITDVTVNDEEELDDTADTNEADEENNDEEYIDDFEAYFEEEADSENEVTLTTSQYVYKPGDIVELKGSLYSDLLSELPEADKVVTIQIIYSRGEDQVVAESNVTDILDDGKFEATIALPQDAREGQYEAKAVLALNVNASELGASVESSVSEDSEELETSTSFLVVTAPESFDIKAEGKGFNVQVASNSTISNVELKQDEKKLSVVVEGEDGTRGVASINIPKDLLSGDIMVFIDGKETSNFKIIEDTNSSIVIEVSYHHSKHAIDVQGTNVVPEFPVPFLGAIAAAIGAIAVLGRTRMFKTF